MKRLLGILALLGLTTGCYVGDTNVQIQITSVRAIQDDPDGDICADDLPGLAGSTTNVATLSAAAAAGVTPLNLARTLFLTSNAQDTLYGFGQDDSNGSGQNDFHIESVVFEYESDLGLAAESQALFFNVPEGTSDSCLQTQIMGDEAIATLAQLALSESTLVTVAIHFEGVYVNGKRDKTNTIRYPVTITP